MGKTTIEWTDRSWNPLRGCTRVSPGCTNCYAERMAARFSKPGMAYEGLAEMKPSGPRWTGKVDLIESALIEPLRRRTPTRYFANSMSDLFHESVSKGWIARIFAVMALSSQYERYGGLPGHTFQILTKRPKRMRETLTSPDFHLRVAHEMRELALENPDLRHTKGSWARDMAREVASKESTVWPIPGVWLGTSTENQETANERIPELLGTPAAVRFISAEPLLGPISLAKAGGVWADMNNQVVRRGSSLGGGLDWVISGGESGPGARPPHPKWFRDLRDECIAAGVAYFFKQWGSFLPIDEPWKQNSPALLKENERWLNLAGGHGFHGEQVYRMREVGKKKAGRELDGKTWSEFPRTGIAA